jgi:acyl-coenzyme A synthetase/AMP-(fatty) acid ligase
VFQLDADSHGVRRIAALAVAPGLDAEAILQTLRAGMDPVFLPRPLRCVDALPRNDTGKLPRAALLALLRGNMS